jgi:hypothetical protein
MLIVKCLQSTNMLCQRVVHLTRKAAAGLSIVVLSNCVSQVFQNEVLAMTIIPCVCLTEVFFVFFLLLCMCRLTI